MTDKAMQLLKKMAAEFDKNKLNSFDSTFYLGYPKSVITELENEEYIIINNDIVSSVELTQLGYKEANK